MWWGACPLSWMLEHLTSAGCLVAVPVNTKLPLGAEQGWLCTFWPQAGKAWAGWTKKCPT